MSATTSNPPANTMTIDVMVRKYVDLRALVKAKEDEAKAAIAPYDLALEALASRMMAHLNENGAQSVKTPHGTVYKSLRTSTKVENWNDTLEYIKANEAWDLLEARVSKTAANDLINSTGKPIPGVACTQELTIGVRKK